MKTLEEKLKELSEYISGLKITEDESKTLRSKIEGYVILCRNQSFEAGQSAANKVHEQTQKIIQEKYKPPNKPFKYGSEW